MKAIIRFLSVWLTLLLTGVILTACAMRVKIDSSLASADGRYSAAVVARTGRGESFDERHEKTIHIGILRR